MTSIRFQVLWIAHFQNKAQQVNGQWNIRTHFTLGRFEFIIVVAVVLVAVNDLKFVLLRVNSFDVHENMTTFAIWYFVQIDMMIYSNFKCNFRSNSIWFGHQPCYISVKSFSLFWAKLRKTFVFCKLWLLTSYEICIFCRINCYSLPWLFATS